MDKKTNYIDLLKSVNSHTFSGKESLLISEMIRKKIKRARSFTKEEKDLFIAYLNAVQSYPIFFNEHLMRKNEYNKAKEILMEKGTDKIRMKAALNVFNLSLSKLNKLKHENLKKIFLILNEKTVELDSKGIKKYSYALNSISHFKLIWHDEPSRKKSIVDCLFHQYKNQYSGKNAIVAQLRKMRCKGLPSY